MDFSNRRYSKPKVLKKRKDLNKYKLRNVSVGKFTENPPPPLDQPLLGARGTAVAAPTMSKVNRNERLTVKQGLFQKSQKSKVVYRNMASRSEQVARLNEDLNALIPSDIDHEASSPYLYEQNNNVPEPLRPAMEVIWQTKSNSEDDPIPPTPKPPSPNYNRSRRSFSPASKPVSPNHNRSRRSVNPVTKPISANHNRPRRLVSPASKPASSNHNRSLRASRSLDQRSLTLTLGSEDSTDPYPRTRAYVNAQRELMAKKRANAFELSSESEEVEIAEEKASYSPSQPNPEMISKYIELVTFVEKKFVHVKKEVFNEAPCNDYFKKLRNELWDSYQRCGQTPLQGESSNLNSLPHDTGQNECETGSLSSEESQGCPESNVEQPQQDEFVFSPNLSSHPTSAGSVLPPHTEGENRSEPTHRFLDNESYQPSHRFHDHESYEPAHRFYDNESYEPAHQSYDERSWRPRDYSPTHSRYRDNCTHYQYSAARSGGSSLVHRPRVRSPDPTTFSTKRYRSGGYQSSMARDSNPQAPDCRDPSGYQYSNRGVTSHVLSPNSRLRDTSEPPRQYYRMSCSNGTDSHPLDLNDMDDDDDESPPMNFYPRKLF